LVRRENNSRDDVEIWDKPETIKKYPGGREPVSLTEGRGGRKVKVSVKLESKHGFTKLL